MERLPGDALGILDPVLVGLRVATRLPGLIERGHAGCRDLRAQGPEFVIRLHLESEMVDSGGPPTPRNRETDLGIVGHPLRVVGSFDSGRSAEELGVETDAFGQVPDGNVNVKSLHAALLFRLDSETRRAGAQRAASPPQQFSVMKPTRVSIAPNSAE